MHVLRNGTIIVLLREGQVARQSVIRAHAKTPSAATALRYNLPQSIDVLFDQLTEF